MKKLLIGIGIVVVVGVAFVKIPIVSNTAKNFFDGTPTTPGDGTRVSGAGVAWGFFLIPQVGNPLEDLRSVSWSRLTGLVWPRFQHADGSYNWPLLDEQVQKAQREGYGLIFVLKTGNNKMISDPACYNATLSYSKNNELFAKEMYLHSCPLKPVYVASWQVFVRDIIERYDGDTVADMPGLRQGFEMDIQIENEAANPYYWHWNEMDGKLAAASFLEILQAAVRARDEANPGTKIILPGFIEPNLLARCVNNQNYATYCSGQHAQRVRAFTEEVLKYPAYFDAIDVHFFDYFKFDPYYIQDGIAWMRSEMQKNGYTKPIYSLEWTGSIMMMVKMEGHSQAFADYFPYTAELSDEGAFGRVYANLNAPENATYRKWFEAEQAREFPKLFTTMLAHGVEKMVYVRFSDYTGMGWDSLWWNWQGLVRYEGTVASPRLIKKPSYYTYQLLEQKLSDYQSVETLDFGDEVFAHKFSFKEKSPVFVVWTEGATAAIDISRSGVSRDVTVTHAVTELDSNNNPVRPSLIRVPASAVPLTDTPVFVEQ